MNHGHAGEIERFQRFLEGRTVLHHHYGRLDQVEQIFQLEVILAHQRVSRRHRRCRKPRLHRRLRHQRMLDRIARQDRDRAPGVESQIAQALRQRNDGALGFPIRQLAPLPLSAGALRQPDSIRRFPGPFRQRSRDMLLVSLQRNPRLQDDDAVRPPLDRDVALQPFDLVRKAGLVSTAAAFPLILRLPEFGPLRIPCSYRLSSSDIDRLSLFEEGPDAFVEIFRAAAQNLIAVFHRDHGFNRSRVDAHIEAFLGEP